MNVTDLAARRGMTPGEKRDAARRDLAADPMITGAELARRYDMTGGWGRARRRAFENETGGTDAAQTVTDEPATVTPPVTRHAPDPTPVVTRHSGLVHTVTVLAVLIVAVVAAVLSYAHMRHLGLEAGEGWRADLLPLSVDGMMVAASMTALAKRRRGKPAVVAWVALMLGVGASLAANIAAAEPTWTGRLLAAWPPLALVLAFELLLEQGRDG